MESRQRHGSPGRSSKRDYGRSANADEEGRGQSEGYVEGRGAVHRRSKHSRHGGETEEERRERKRIKRERKERKRMRRDDELRNDEIDTHGSSDRFRSRAESNDLSARDSEDDGGGTLHSGHVESRRAYDDEDNASVPFVWKKKDNMLRRKGIKVTREGESARREAAAEELERAKARREERQRERDEIEAERAREARSREQEMNADWDRMEESFHGQQHFMRQAIRLRENRPTVADSLARNIRLDLLELTADSNSPCDILNGLVSSMSRDVLLEVYDAIQLELDYVPDFTTDDDTTVFNRATRLEWWECMEVFVKDLVAWCAPGSGASRSDVKSNGRGRDGLPRMREVSRVHPSVQEDLENMLKGKSRNELVEMESTITPRVEGPVAQRDGSGDEDFAEVDFWQAALGRIRRGVAEARIAELNVILAKERASMLAAALEDSEGGLGKNIPEPGADAENSREGHVDMGEEEMVRAEEAKGMRENEERFAEVADVNAGQTYAWNDKYRPRRPRFFNRVQTGYDWNKYNRTHYDHDNPPPKTVQGYKFNIFYPDLIDRTVAPTFVVSKTDNPEVCILTFKAGPPYEDIAFKIVSRPWEHSHKRGFRCTFDRGVLQLWFNFRRLRYRR